MADLRGFDANTVEPNADFDPIPAGKYLAVITESEMKANKAGTGSYLQFTFEIIDGEHKGRVLWARLNLNHPNATAVRIAQAELSALCRALSVPTPNDSTDLHDLPLVIHVKCKRRTDSDEIQNEIRGYAPKASLHETAATAKPVAATAAAGKPTTPPWKR